MENCLEVQSCLVIRENDLAQCPAIEPAVHIDYVIAESLADFVKRGLSGLHHVTRDNVRVDYRDPQVREHVGYRRLAAGDATG